MRFPTITTDDLNRQQRVLPRDFAGDVNLLLVAYLQQHQREVNTWVPSLLELERRIDGFRYYELPVVGKMNLVGRKSLDYFMRAGIPDPDVRERTLTLYVDRAEFRRALDIPTEDTIGLVLLDAHHEVVWQGLGPWQQATAVALEAALAATVGS